MLVTLYWNLFLDQGNYCRHSFVAAVAITTSTLIAGVLEIFEYMPDDGSTKNILILVILALGAITGIYLYARNIGKLIRSWGWDEYSFFRGVAFAFIFIPLGLALDVVLIAVLKRFLA